MKKVILTAVTLLVVFGSMVNAGNKTTTKANCCTGGACCYPGSSCCVGK